MRLYEQLKVPNNWAFDVYQPEKMVVALKLAEREILRKSVGKGLNINSPLSDDEIDTLQDAAYLCEIAALEWWQSIKSPDESNVNDRQQFSQACALGFTFLRSLPLPSDDASKISHVLRVIALGYLCDRGTDVKRWLSENETCMVANLTNWDGQVLTRIFETWIRLVRRKNWDDVSQIVQIISGLRAEQRQHESIYLNEFSGTDIGIATWQLVSLYHWAKATEVLAEFMLQGTPTDATVVIDFHFDKAFLASEQSGSFELGNLLRWLQLASHQFIRNSVWNVAKRFNSNITKYTTELVSSSRTTLELLPPQRRAIFEEGLLDRTHNAIVVSLPTSSGKTSLAIFRILEAINHFGENKAWIVYTAPTRALVNQIVIRLRHELSPLNIKVERLSAASEIDQIEEQLLGDTGAFDVLVCTPEKLDVIIRQHKVHRELALYIMDEAHSLEEEERGLKHELLLAMIRRDCPNAKFLLLTPFVSNGLEVARWLDPQAPGSISMSLDWQPNDRVIGKVWAEPGDSARNWSIKFESLATSHPSLEFDSPVNVGQSAPLNRPFNEVKSNLTFLACAAASQLHNRGVALVITSKKPLTWSAAAELKQVLPEKNFLSNEVQSVINFLRAEYGDEYDLIELLRHGIGVHHSGLSEEARILIEWLTEDCHIDVLCATTTIAQGINFPVGSIFLSSVKYPYGKKMKYREFWNLVGRAGRVGQPGIGIIGISAREGDFGKDSTAIRGYLSGAHGKLLSRLLSLYEEAKSGSGDLNLQRLANEPAWSSFLQYLAHLFNQSDKDRLLGAQLELTLRDTFGFRSLESSNPEGARDFVQAVRKYVGYLYEHPENAELAEATGFAPDNAYRALKRVREEQISDSDWTPMNLFAHQGNALRKLMGVMLRIPELSRLKDVTSSGLNHRQLASLTSEWVNGHSLKDLAEKYYGAGNTDAITKCCDAIYSKLVNNATWGIASLQKLSGLNFEEMEPEKRRQLNVVPAMIYYGVNTEEAVLMRMNGVARSAAYTVGTAYIKGRDSKQRSSRDALEWLANLDARQWSKILPENYPMSGQEYQSVWQRISGIE